MVLNLKGVRVGLCVVYRPPHLRYTCLTALFRSLFVDLAVEVKSVLCMGDTNIDLLSTTSNEANYFRRLLRESNAVQLIKEPTRVTANSATLLDHIIVDRSTEVKRIGVIDAPSLVDHNDRAITDHKLVYCSLDCKKDKPGPQLISYRDFSKFDSDEAIRRIAEVDWDSAVLIE